MKDAPGGLSLASIKKVARDILRGLQFIHTTSVHTDIKPENILATCSEADIVRDVKIYLEKKMPLSPLRLAVRPEAKFKSPRIRREIDAFLKQVETKEGGKSMAFKIIDFENASVRLTKSITSS